MIWVTNIIVWSYDYVDFQKILTLSYRSFVANSSQLYDQVTIATLLSQDRFTIKLPRSYRSYDELTKSKGHWVNFCWIICHLFMVALCNRADHIYFHPVVCSFFFFFLAYFQRLETGCLPYSHTWCGLSANLGCRSETCWTRLAGNAGRKKSPKSRDLRTIVQLCRAISSQLRHASTIGKKNC